MKKSIIEKGTNENGNYVIVKIEFKSFSWYQYQQKETKVIDPDLERLKAFVGLKEKGEKKEE